MDSFFLAPTQFCGVIYIEIHPFTILPFSHRPGVHLWDGHPERPGIYKTNPAAWTEHWLLVTGIVSGSLSDWAGRTLKRGNLDTGSGMKCHRPPSGQEDATQATTKVCLVRFQ